MRALADILNSSGVKQGDGPITTVTSVTYRQVLDGIGQATVTMPATDERADALTAVRQRITVRRPLPNGTLSNMFTESVIMQKQVKDGPGGSEIVLRCLDKVSLLENANTGIARKFKNVDLDDVLTTLLALSSGFTHSFVDSGLDTLPVHKRFDGVSVLKAMQEVLAIHGLHWYAVGGTIYVTSGGNVADGVMFNMQTVPASFAETSAHAAIEELTVEDDADKLVTKLIPLGKGDGDKALSLKLSTRTTPYTIQNETVNGRTQWYISDSAAVTAYGTITRIVKFDEIAPTDPGRVEKIAAANQLYDAAVAHLERMKQPVTRYTARIVNPNTAYGNFGVPRPSEKRRLIYRGYATGAGGNEFAYLSLDQELWVVGVQETLNLSGYSATVELADYDVPPESTAGKIVSEIQTLKAGQRTPDADTFYEATRQTTNNTAQGLIGIQMEPETALMLIGEVIAARDDITAALLATVRAVWKRDGSGNVTVAGTDVVVSEDSASAPTVGVTTFNSSPAFEGVISVTGVTSQTWNWKMTYRLVHLLD